MIIKTRLLKRIKGITLFPFIFISSRKKILSIDINHEKIHLRQQRELLVIFFYLLYFLFWIINLFKYWNLDKAYKNIAFERESYIFEGNLNYLKQRKRFAWFNYV